MDPPPGSRAPSISETNRDKADNAARRVEVTRGCAKPGINFALANNCSQPHQQKTWLSWCLELQCAHTCKSHRPRITINVASDHWRRLTCDLSFSHSGRSSEPAFFPSRRSYPSSKSSCGPARGCRGPSVAPHKSSCFCHDTSLP